MPSHLPPVPSQCPVAVSQLEPTVLVSLYDKSSQLPHVTLPLVVEFPCVTSAKLPCVLVWLDIKSAMWHDFTG